MKLEAETERLDKEMFLHAQAIDFKADGIEGTLTHTFGLGGASLLLRVEVDGVTVRERIDVAKLLEQWADKIVEEVRDA